MSEFEVAIKIAGKLDKSLQTSVSSAQKMLGSLGKGGLSSALTGIGNVMESTGKALTTGVTMPVIALGATSVKEFGSVDKSMKLVQATMGSTDAQAKQLESTMKKAAANSVFGMQDAADATLNFARQGFNAKQAGDMLTPALNLAAGTATDLSVVTGGLGNALKMFGKDSNYAATAADILSTAQAQANTTVTDLFDAMATAGPICSSVGWSMSDLAAITDIFGDAGISGAEGATALKTGLARLASPAKDGATWIKKLGLEIFNSDGSMKSMVDVQKQLHDSFQGLTSQEQMSAAAALAMAAGATAGGAALLILAAGALAASVGMVPLAAALALAAASVKIIGASAKAAGSALKSMAKGATGTAAKMAIIAAGAAPLAAALAPLAVAAAAAAAAVLALAAGSTAAAAAIMLLAAGITMTAGALTLCSASITAFKASAAGINAVATPTAAAFTRMAAAVAPFTAAITALAGPMMATSASMVVFAGGITVAAASATALAVSLRSTMATLGTLGALTTVAMNMVTVAIRNSMTQSNQAVVTGITVMRTTTQTGMTTIVAVTRNGMTMFVVAVRTGGNQAVAACRSTSSQMVGAFSGLSGSMYSAGSFAMAGLRNGIAAGGAAAIAQARSIANQVAATVNSALKIHSPSRVLDQSGQYAGQGLAGGIQKTGALVQKAANESLAQPVMNAGSKTLEAPQFENRSSVIGDTVSAFTGQKQSGNGNSNESASQQFVFSPTYRFEAGTPSKEDMVEANRMSQAEFKKMMKEYLRTEGRRAFA